MGNPNNSSCSACDFYIDSGDSISGICVWSPPSAIGQNWPPVKATDWCGHFNITTPSGPASGFVWASYVPVLASTVGTFTSAAISGRWTSYGTTNFIRVKIVVTTIGTAAGALTFTLPEPSENTGVQNIIPGVVYSGTDAWKPWSATIPSNTVTATANDATGGFVLANTDMLIFEGFYEA